MVKDNRIRSLEGAGAAVHVLSGLIGGPPDALRQRQQSARYGARMTGVHEFCDTDYIYEHFEEAHLCFARAKGFGGIVRELDHDALYNWSVSAQALNAPPTEPLALQRRDRSIESASALRHEVRQLFAQVRGSDANLMTCVEPLYDEQDETSEMRLRKIDFYLGHVAGINPRFWPTSRWILFALGLLPVLFYFNMILRGCTP